MSYRPIAMKQIARRARMQRKLRAAQRIPFYGVIARGEPAMQQLVVKPKNPFEVFLGVLARFGWKK